MTTRFAGLAILAVAFCATAALGEAGDIVPPAVRDGAKRSITIDDIGSLRDVGALTVSPDGRRFAAWVYQGDAGVNAYRSGWFVGDVSGGALTYVGDGGPGRPKVMFTGHVVGEIGGGEARWSPDGTWIAYTRYGDDGLQLWRGKTDGSFHEQLTRNTGDVRAFAWREDGRALYFSVSPPRAETAAAEKARSWEGYRFDDDLWTYSDLLAPALVRAPKTDPAVWLVTLDDKHERIGADADRAAFEQARAAPAVPIKDAAGAVVARRGGGWAWLAAPASGQGSRLAATLTPDTSTPTFCADAACTGTIRKLMWSTDGRRVLFWRGEGINDVDSAFYAWEPATGNVTTVLRLGDDELRLCAEAADDRLVCVRETASSPAHVIAIDFRDGSLKTISDINPEFRNIRLGRVERFEWDTPKFAWNEPGGALAGLYPKRAYGFIITPPDFDPSKQYPVFIDPYVAHGFNPLGAEHALHVYAANGFVVLRTAFPLPQRQVGMKQMYSEKLGFPHLSMLMESTVRGLDAAAARAFIDEKRVGVGGVSHGTFVPLFMMQKHDRIAAISISSPTWGPIQSFGGTRKGREALAKFTDAANYDWTPKPFSDGARVFWRQIDIAEHVDKIEAPILMNLAASETFTLLPLIRQLSDGRLPYDAYVFTGETHIKWQPAHLRHIMQRNLDWFRFWLQDREDNDPAKGEQYVRWRELRKLQCANPRTLIANCGP